MCYNLSYMTKNGLLCLLDVIFALVGGFLSPILFPDLSFGSGIPIFGFIFSAIVSSFSFYGGLFLSIGTTITIIIQSLNSHNYIDFSLQSELILLPQIIIYFGIGFSVIEVILKIVKKFINNSKD